LRNDPWRASPARWLRIPPPGFVRPCEPRLVDRPPAGEGWLHKVKHDGFRVVVRKLGGRAKVWSRRGADFTERFAAIAEAVRSLDVDRVLIDGEAAVLREDGRSEFAALMTKRGGFEASLVAFDLLRLDGEDWRERLIEGRREALARLVAGAGGIVFNEALAAEGAVVFGRRASWGSRAWCRSGRGAATRAGRVGVG
jgi:ATP-dependent DNA ligase